MESKCPPASKAHSIPWEILLHIFSFADQSSLASLSLVSTPVWQIANPRLYRNVEITSLRALVGLLFVETTPSSARLSSSTIISSLTLRLPLVLHSPSQPSIPFLLLTGHPPLTTQHDPRLLLAYCLPRSIGTLLLPIENVLHSFDFILEHILPRVNPLHLVFSTSSSQAISSGWTSYSTSDVNVSHSVVPSFVDQWTRLEKITFQSHTWRRLEARRVTSAPFTASWFQQHRRSLEMVFDFVTGRGEDGYASSLERGSFRKKKFGGRSLAGRSWKQVPCGGRRSD